MQETVAQLGPIMGPITGIAPTDVQGESQLSEAYTSVRDNGLPGGRGLVRSLLCNFLGCRVGHSVAVTVIAVPTGCHELLTRWFIGCNYAQLHRPFANNEI